MERLSREVFTRTAIVAAMAGLCLAGCAEGSPQPTIGDLTTEIDRDGDGAPNTIDPYPNTANPTDWDADSIINSDDLHPYDPGTIYSDTVSGGDAPASESGNDSGIGNSGHTPTGCMNDRDCDSIPDYKDTYPDIYDRSELPEDDDWDDDGLPNDLDSSPRNRDRDMDGKLDGYDPDPDYPNDGINESSDRNPYTDDDDRDNDGVDDIYDSDPRDPFEN